MLMRIGYEIGFELPAATPIICLLYVHPEVAGRLQQPETLQFEPPLSVTQFMDAFGNHAARIYAPAGDLLIRFDNVIEASAEPEQAFPNARQHPVEDLPAETLQFLLASRYCEVDRLADEAWRLFKDSPPGWSRVQAICDWVYAWIEFGYPHARPTKTAYDVFVERKGVCRDFMHLAITFCRCVNIPARYATGYLADIGVPPSANPMDFSAFFEVYLDGAWHPFDARNNIRRTGRVLMARGRDAADTALTTAFGEATLRKFEVWTDEVL